MNESFANEKMGLQSLEGARLWMLVFQNIKHRAAGGL
jgi:hypothetical protein